MNREPRILFIDIETAPIIMAAWTTYEASAVWVERDTYIMSIAYKWMGERRAQSKILPDFSRYKSHKHCDRDLCGFIWKLLNEADIVVAHNGDAFDVKKINSRLIVHGHEPPSGYKTIDTLKIARKVFKFDSNKLDNLGRYLGEGRKIPNTGAALWRGCVNGDPKSWRTMGRYNRQDVDLLASVYDRVKAWAPSHPNLNLYTGRDACPVCQSTHTKRSGMHYLKTTIRQRFKCQDCGARWCGDVVKPWGQTCEGDNPVRPARAISNARAASSTRKPARKMNRTTRSRSTAAAKRRANEAR